MVILASRVRLVALIAIVGFQLRSVVLSVPPVLPVIRDDLHLSFTAAGALTSVPVLCLGAAAVPGALLANRVGARLVVGAGSIGLGVSALLRLLPPAPVPLFLFSATMALCAAAAQPAMAAVLRVRFPDSVQRASTIFTCALGLGGLAGSALTVHLLAAGGWRGTFVVWGGLSVVAGLLWLVGVPGRSDERQRQPSHLRGLMRDPAVWHVAGIFGAQSLVFYACASWIPFQVRGLGPGFLALVLLALNGVNLPISLLLVALPGPWARQRGFYVAAGILMSLGAAGFVAGATGAAWLWAVLVGTGTSMTFAGANALPALFARTPRHVAGYAALVLTAAYALSFVGPFLGGVLVDQTHRLNSPFWIVGAAAAGVIALGLTLPRREPADGVAPEVP